MVRAANDTGLPSYLTIDQLSEISRISVTQLRRWVAEEKIPCYQPGGKGGKLLFPFDAIEQSSRRGCPGAAGPSAEPAKPKRLPGPRPKWTNADYHNN